MRTPSPSFYAVCLGSAALFLLTGCSPTYNWREVRGTTIPYTVLLPAKPSSLSRPVNLDGVPVEMNMTAAEVDGVTFAVGTAELPDAAKAQHALSSMKTALVKNIGGTIKQEKTVASAPGVTIVEVEATGAPSAKSGGERRLLFARFATKGTHAYQAVAVGKEKSVSREAVDTFLSSFKPQ